MSGLDKMKSRIFEEAEQSAAESGKKRCGKDRERCG